MWLMIIKNIPVQEQFRPDFMSIYWGVPWLDSALIKREFIRCNLRYLTEFDYSSKELHSIPDEVFENIHDESRYPKEWATLLKRFVSSDRLVDVMGFTPNPSRAMKVLINNEAVKLWPHEYSEIDNNKLLYYIKEGSHDFKASNVAEEQITNFVFDDITKTMYEQCVLEGCTEHEAKLMCLGVNISERYEVPPIGYYKIKKEYQKIFA